MVIWIIGLSGSGKTTLSKLMYERLKPQLPNLVRLDGDVLRELFGNDVDHTIEGRRRNAQRLSVLSKFLADQGIHIVAAVLSIFPDWREWNRANIPDYAEIYLRVSLTTLRRRDTKCLYARALSGQLPNVVGVDIAFPEPSAPELILDNEADRPDLGELADSVFSLPAVRSALGRA
ncbi:MAG TPA: adenylyl-sulfate kinase [Burkholderiales bacterium]|nr:adenylyl-sulfate kinase [Burkholderiales bacterium]